MSSPRGGAPDLLLSDPLTSNGAMSAAVVAAADVEGSTVRSNSSNAHLRLVYDSTVPLHTAWTLAAAGLGGFLFGYDTAIVNGGLFLMRKSLGFDAESWIAGFIVSSAILGAVVGSIAGGVLANAKGRKPALLLADATFVVGSLVIALAPNVTIVIIGRLILGVGIGIASIVVPVYLAELTPPKRRGAAIVANNVALTGAQFGASLVAVVFVYSEPEGSTDPWGWRPMFGLAAVPALIQVALLWRLPESPSYLWMSKQPREEVVRAAARVGIAPPTACFALDTEESTLRGMEEDETKYSCEDAKRVEGAEENGRDGEGTELNPPAVGISDGHDDKEEPPPASLVDLARSKLMRPRVRLGVLLQLFQQLCGINTVMYYSATILKHAGFHGERAPIVFSVPLAGTNALSTLVGVWAVERFGRRRLIFASLSGCMVSLTAFTIIAFVVGDHDVSQTAAGMYIVSLVAYVAAFAPGIGAVPWVINGEIYPLRFRSAAASVASVANWSSNAAVSQVFPVLMGVIGTGPTFAGLVGMCTIALGTLHRILPETRGVPLEAMEHGLPPVR